MKPWKRIAITAGAVVLVGFAGLAARVLMLGGVFDRVAPVALACKPIPGVTGPEDIAFDRADGLLFVSASDRRAPGSKADGIYVLSLIHPEKGLVKLAGAPSVFHPHGIGLFRAADGSLTLMAVNHLDADHHAVDIFEIVFGGDGVAPKLNELGDIQSDKLIHPNDVAAVGREQFYVTNDHGSRSDAGMQAENYLTLPRANVLYFDGAVFREAATGLVFANGIAVSKDGARVYVAETTMRRIRTFTRDAFSGRLTEENVFALPAGPDNIDIAPNGSLVVAAHPKLFGLLAYAKDSSRPSPTEILQVMTQGGVPQSVSTVYANDGRAIGAGSVAVVTGEDLFIGSVFDSKILDCRLR